MLIAKNTSWRKETQSRVTFECANFHDDNLSYLDTLKHLFLPKGSFKEVSFHTISLDNGVKTDETLESLSFTYTANGKRHIQVKNFSK